MRSRRERRSPVAELMVYLIRFFRVVSPLTGPTRLAWTVTVGSGVVAMLLAPERAGDTLYPVLLLQLFASSSGFSTMARRGYYDMLLTREHGRMRIAVMHWAMSAYAGVISWLTLAGMETLVRGLPLATMAAGTIVAVLLVSTVPWALTAALPRHTAAIGWLLSLALWQLLAPDWALPLAIQGVAYPPALVGITLGDGVTAAALVAATVALATIAVACLWIHRSDVPLEAAQ